MRVTLSYLSDMEPEPVPPYTGLVEDQPNTFSLVSVVTGRVPSFFNSTMPSLAISEQSSMASLPLSSLMEPEPVAREIRVDMGPKQTRLMVMASAASTATPAWARIMYFLDLDSFFAAKLTMRAMTASATTTPKKIN